MIYRVDLSTIPTPVGKCNFSTGPVSFLIIELLVTSSNYLIPSSLSICVPTDPSTYLFFSLGRYLNDSINCVIPMGQADARFDSLYYAKIGSIYDDSCTTVKHGAVGLPFCSHIICLLNLSEFGLCCR